MTFDLNAGVQAGSKRAAGSTWVPRISAIQQAAMERACATMTFTADELAQLDRYAVTGDLSHLATSSRHILTDLCKIAKEGLNTSQAKRIWPRKMATVIIANS